MRPKAQTLLTQRPGRLILIAALVLTLAGAGAPIANPPAAVCQFQPSGRKGWLCWCRGPYGWKPAPKLLCQVQQ